MPTLIISNQTRHELSEGTTTIGRHPVCDIVLNDGSVSNRHAEIICAADDITIRDLGSANKTSLNGEEIHEATLKDGDVILFAETECRFLDTPRIPVVADTVADETVKLEADKSFAAKLKSFFGALWKETRRAGQITGLKAKVAKLKTVDLNTAHYALGKRCYELALHKERFAADFADIEQLEELIAKKKAGKSADGEETNTDKAKRSFGNLAGKAEAQMVELKLKQKFVALGLLVADEGNHELLVNELEAKKRILEQIATFESDAEALDGGNAGRVSYRARYWATMGVVAVLVITAFWSLFRTPRPNERVFQTDSRTPPSKFGAVAALVSEKDILEATATVRRLLVSQNPVSDIQVDAKSSRCEITISGREKWSFLLKGMSPWQIFSVDDADSPSLLMSFIEETMPDGSSVIIRNGEETGLLGIGFTWNGPREEMRRAFRTLVSCYNSADEKVSAVAIPSNYAGIGNSVTEVLTAAYSANVPFEYVREFDFWRDDRRYMEIGAVTSISAWPEIMVWGPAKDIQGLELNGTKISPPR